MNLRNRANSLLLVVATVFSSVGVCAFAPQLQTGVVSPSAPGRRQSRATSWMTKGNDEEDPIQSVIDAMYGGQPLEKPEQTRARIQELVDAHPVLLFMKGSKSFPQCGFSDTATKILETLKVDFHTVDVLSDQAIREGIKQYSQWPTIPQVCALFGTMECTLRRNRFPHILLLFP